MYEFLVLSVLAKLPMHGYRVVKVLGTIMGPFKQLQWGALYPVLARLESEGMIEATEQQDDAGTSRKVYSITPQGRELLHRHVMDTEHHLGEYATLFHHKVALFPLLSPEERLYLCRHYAVYAQQNIDHHERRSRELCSDSSSPLSVDYRDSIARVNDHRAEYWRHERAWAEELLAEAAADVKRIEQEVG